MSGQRAALIEVLAAHQWHHTRDTHCACGFRTPLTQLAFEGWLQTQLAFEGWLQHLADAILAALPEAGEAGWPCDDYLPPLTCWTTPKPKTLICEGCRDAFPQGAEVQATFRAQVIP